ncbi:hypothetical protein N665_1917s0001, partial [Sinapis alba]
SSNHQILLVGEGDFSFSCCLATRFPSASNICASSLDSYDDVVRKYKKARSNLDTLKRLGASLLHGVDATKLQLHPHLNCRRFDRIIFNFPHAGFHGKETDSKLIRKHRELVFGFLHAASRMVRADGGEIHVSHKNKAPFCHWKLEELASRCSLALKQCVAFEKSEYPGYENKRGDGSRCDLPFPLGECTTFKFRVSRVAKEIYAEKVRAREMKERESKLFMYPLQPQTQSQGVSQRPLLSFHLSYHHHHQDHNLRQVHDPLVQSRQRTSPPLDLGGYYRELSQFEDGSSIRATTQRPASFAALERHHDHWYQDNNLRRYNERSSLDYRREEEEGFLACSRRFSGVPLDIYNRETQSYPRWYSPERRPLLCQEEEEPFFLRSSHGWEGQRAMSRSTSFHQLHTEESQEPGSLIRHRNLNIYHPYHW